MNYRNHKAVGKARKAVIYSCLSNGVFTVAEIQKIMKEVGKGRFSPVMVAGCKAAITKGQNVPA